jgi:hypothetical protein
VDQLINYHFDTNAESKEYHEIINYILHNISNNQDNIQDHKEDNLYRKI